MQAVRAALPNAATRLNDSKGGPYDIDPAARLLNGQLIDFELASAPNNAHTDAARSRWSAGESEWHKQTVTAVAENPQFAGVNPADVLETWHDSLFSGTGVRLWERLRTLKHPDVVFGCRHGQLNKTS
jgi:hypothetical protein